MAISLIVIIQISAKNAYLIVNNAQIILNVKFVIQIKYYIKINVNYVYVQINFMNKIAIVKIVIQLVSNV